jgi:hypothetical protein
MNRLPGSSFWSKRRRIQSEVDKEIRDLCQERATLQQSRRDDSSGESGPTRGPDSADARLCVADVVSIPVEDSSLGAQVDLVSDEYSSTDGNSDSDSHCSSDYDSDSGSFANIHAAPNVVDWNNDSNSDSDESLDESSIDTNFRNRLASWATKYAISLVALTALLGILRTLLPHIRLPKTARTLLGTATKVKDIKVLSGGQYYHFGIAKGLKQFLLSSFVSDSASIDEIRFQVNIDGCPVFKGSNAQFWPIQCMMSKRDHKYPFIVGLWQGDGKPVDLGFLDDFIDEASHLEETGLELNGRVIPVSIDCFVCDAQGRDLLKSIVYHSGYSSCERCTLRGAYQGKVYFPVESAPLRTDASFRSQTDSNHHSGETSITQSVLATTMTLLE